MGATVFAALIDVLQFHNILASIIGVMFGLFIGSTPGLTISLGMVLLLPITFRMEAVTSICLLLGLYASGMTGGSLSAILLNIPGTPSGSATAIDGHAMAKKGRAGEALGVAVSASFFGGIFGLTCLVLAAPLIAKVALRFGAPELFSIVLLGLTLICSFGQKSVIKGLISGVLGLIIMTVGLDPMMGRPRFTFGQVELQAGISFLPAMIGLFAIPQILLGISSKTKIFPEYKEKLSGVLPKIGDLFKLVKTMLLGSVIGTGVGAIPGAGGPIAVFLSYDYARRISKKGSNYGRGEPEGVAAPESSNNAVAGGALQHLAFNVEGEAELLAMRDRIRSRGVNIIGPIDHGMCQSLYFAGPEDLTLEIATSEKGIDGRAWIDPEVVGLAGITADELDRYRDPASFETQGGTIPQPPIDPAKPHMRGYPENLYRAIIGTPDEVITAQASETDPPVVVED